MAIERFKLIPWRGGLNLATDSTVLNTEQVVKVDNIIQDVDEIKKKREGIKFFDDASSSGESIIGLVDYWRTDSAGAKAQLLIGVSSNGNVYSYDATGARTILTVSDTAITSPTRVSFEVQSNTLVIGLDGATNVPKKYNPNDAADVKDLGGTPPRFLFVREHLGRLWTNDQDNPERFHYTSTGSIEEWNGTGDSGALDIFPGDGDPEGITGIFPSFKGSIFVGKLTKLYEVSGFTPESFAINPVSTGVGVSSHNSIVAVDQDDVFYASQRGFHSLSATASFGNFESAFISKDIQPEFNKFQAGRKKFIKSGYIPSFNSIVWGVSQAGSSTNMELFFYNLILSQWYKWPNLSCESLVTRSEDASPRLYTGTNNGRVIKTQNGNFKDTLDSVDLSDKLGVDFLLGTSQLGISTFDFSIPFRIKTGTVYPDNNPRSLKNFLGVAIWVKPKDTYTLEGRFKIDNQKTQTFTITETQTFDLLGSTFILGTSELGALAKAFPIYRSVDGVGYGATLELEEDTVEHQMEILGYSIDFERVDEVNEVIINP